MSIQILNQAENVDRQVAPEIAPRNKSALGQFMTPASVANFMASLFPPSSAQNCVLLDAGAVASLLVPRD